MDEKKKNVLIRFGGFLFDIAAALVSSNNPKKAPVINAVQTSVDGIVQEKTQ